VDILTREFNVALTEEEFRELHNSNELGQKIISHIQDHITVQEDKVPQHVVNRLLATISLQVIDKYRVQHLSAMQYLRDKVGLMSYAQLDPLVIYKKE
jgi:preprotein translocase subunit SecA